MVSLISHRLGRELLEMRVLEARASLLATQCCKSLRGISGARLEEETPVWGVTGLSAHSAVFEPSIDCDTVSHSTDARSAFVSGAGVVAFVVSDSKYGISEFKSSYWAFVRIMALCSKARPSPVPCKCAETVYRACAQSEFYAHGLAISAGLCREYGRGSGSMLLLAFACLTWLSLPTPMYCTHVCVVGGTLVKAGLWVQLAAILDLLIAWKSKAREYGTCSVPGWVPPNRHPSKDTAYSRLPVVTRPQAASRSPDAR